MGRHDFTPLEQKYLQTIKSLRNDPFTSHEFILALAQKNQKLYIEALHAYRDGNPFQVVHGQLAKRLKKFVNQAGYDRSADIFGTSQKCPQWKK